jgi:hypothetical protein
MTTLRDQAIESALALTSLRALEPLAARLRDARSAVGIDDDIDGIPAGEWAKALAVIRYMTLDMTSLPFANWRKVDDVTGWFEPGYVDDVEAFCAAERWWLDLSPWFADDYDGNLFIDSYVIEREGDTFTLTAGSGFVETGLDDEPAIEHVGFATFDAAAEDAYEHFAAQNMGELETELESYAA